MKTQNSTNYKRAFNEKSYDRLAITVPKGLKAQIEAHAKAKGESVNGLVNALLRQEMGLTEDQWKKADEQKPENE